MRSGFALLVVLLGGCATVVSNPDLVIAGEAGQSCYMHDSARRPVADGAPIGLLPALVLSMTEDRIPTRCGLTIAEAQDAALELAYNDNARAAYRQKRPDNALLFAVRPINHDGECMQAEFTVGRIRDNAVAVKHVRYVEVCRSPGGTPGIARDNLPEAAIMFPPLPPHRPEY